MFPPGRRVVGAGVWLAAALVLLVAACENNGTGPSPVPAGPGVRQPSVVRLEIVGPGSIPPDGSEQFRVVGYWSDGSQRNVTNEAAWSSEDRSIVSVLATGLASGLKRGETDIHAAFAEIFATKRVFVLPPGTFRVSGMVLDANVEVTGARVEVAAGSSAGLSTISEAGNYALYGVAGPTEIRASKEGFSPRVERVDVSNHRSLNIYLALERPPWDPSGTYTLTIAAAPECRSVLPEDARVRNYRVVLKLSTVNARYVAVSFEEPRLADSNWSFWTGRIGDTSVLFEANEYYGAALIEQLSESRFFFLSVGTYASTMRAEVSPLPVGLEGTFHGTLAVGVSRLFYESTARCASGNHRFTFSR
jgi:hypothetical protein